MHTFLLFLRKYTPAFCLFFFLWGGNVFGQTVLAGWDFSALTGGTNNFGTSPLLATTSNSSLTIGGLTRGSGISTTGASAGNAWGGTDFITASPTKTTAISGNEFATFTISANTGFTFSLSSISAYNIRRSSTGPTTGIWQYQINSGSFVDIGSDITWGGTTTAAGNAQPAIDLSGITALQNIASGTIITLRCVTWGATAVGGTWYLNDPLDTTANDIVVNGTVASAGKTSVASGDWNTDATWNPVGVPTVTDNVTIAAGHVVYTTTTLTRNATTTVNGAFELRDGGYADGTGTFIYNSTTGTLNFNTNEIYVVNNDHKYWPTTAGPVNVNVLRDFTDGAPAGFILNSAPRTVTGTLSVRGAIDNFGVVQLSSSILTIQGKVQINPWGTFDQSPTYTNSSTLEYNNVDYFVNNEWSSAGQVAGLGIPRNVTLINSTVTLPDTPRGMAGDLTIDATSTFNLNSQPTPPAPGNSLNIAGNWINAGTFNHNNKAVTFTLTNLQTITKTVGGVVSPETFSTIIVQKTASRLQLESDVNLTSTNRPLQLLQVGQLDLNGKILSFNNDNGNIYVNGSNRTITSNVANGRININALKGVANNNGTGTLILGPNVTVNLNPNGRFDFGLSSNGYLTTLNGTLSINSNDNCFVNFNPPIYGSASKLVYNSGGIYGRTVEWSSTIGAGYPNAVQVSNNTTLDYPNTDAALFSTPLAIAKDLTIDMDSLLLMNYGGGENKSGNLTVGRDVLINGTLGLGDAFGGDLIVGGNWTRTETGTFSPNNRAVFFNGTVAQTIAGPGITGVTTTFDYLTINNSAGVSLAPFSPIINNFTVNFVNGKITLGSSIFTIANGGTITDFDSEKYFVTNGSGQLRRTVGATDVVFPVGRGAYNPITFNNSGTQDAYGVRVIDEVTATALVPQKTVSTRWLVSETIAGGSNLKVVAQYNTGQVNTQFNAGITPKIGFYNVSGTAWSEVNATQAGSDPFILTSNVNFVEPFINGTNYFALGKDNAFTTTAEQYVVTNVTPNPAGQGYPVSITVQAQDAFGLSTNVSANSTFTLTTNGNAGIIGGNVTGTIVAGTNSIVVSGVLLDGFGTGVTVTATNSSGLLLNPGTSAGFTVLAKATELDFGIAPPASGIVNTNLSTFTVRALRPDDTVDTFYTGQITIAKASGSGNLTGTLTSNAVAGIATFSTYQFSASDTYTIIASATGLTSVTSGNIFISPNPATAYFRSNVTSGTWNTPGSWQISENGSTGWVTSTAAPTSTAAKIDILNSHKIQISTSGVSMTNTFVQNGGILEITTSSSFNLSGDEEIELTVEDGGAFLVNSPGSYASPTGNAFGLIKTGGKLIAGPNMGSGSAFSDAYLGELNGIFYFGDQSICEWLCPTTVLGSASPSDTNFFFPYETGDMPIFRISTTPAFQFGADDVNNIFYAILEVNANFSVRLSGTKTFLGGIRGTATITQNSNSGALILGNATNVDFPLIVPIIEGSVTLNVLSAGLRLPNGATVPVGATPIIKSTTNTQNHSINRQGGNITVDGSLDITNMRITNTASGGIVVNGTLKTSNTGGLYGASSAIVDGVLALNSNSTIEYYASLNQAISTSPSYYNVTFSGAGTKTISSAVSINTDGLVTITGSTTVDAIGNLGSTDPNSTAFTMDGGRLILRTGGDQPNMRGSYNLTGGVVEFAGTSSKLIRTPKSYHNIEITGTDVGKMSDDISLNSGGTLVIKPTGIFTINTGSIIGAAGSQTLTVENGGTFRTGDLQGFSGGDDTSIHSNIETVNLEDGSTVEYSRSNVQTITAFKPLANDQSNLTTGGYYNLKISGDNVGNLTAKTLPPTPGGVVYVRNNLSVDNPSLLKIESNKTLIVNKNVTTVNSDDTKGIFIEDSGSLVQIADIDNDNPLNNAGEIKMERITKPLFRYDYTYWSSPVQDFILKSVSPTTLFDKFFSWNQAATTQAWLMHNMHATLGNPTYLMEEGRGYIVRAPQGFDIEGQPGAESATYTANFVGKPNNGTVQVDVFGSTSPVVTDNKWNLLGNPYPSAIYATAFLNQNTNLGGTLYFWTHNTSIGTVGSGLYSPNDYAAWNGTGSAATLEFADGNGDEINDNAPSGKIAAGQGFFVKGIGNGAGTATFNNTMRVVEAGENDQFFKGFSAEENTVNTTPQEKHRVWLNMKGAVKGFNQLLVGYVENATNDYDNRFDGESFGGNLVTFYSINNTKNLVIQGRALPFVNTDTVPLGYKTTLTGNLTISIDHVDGGMVGQDIYLQDNVLNVVHDLMASNYVFATVPGTFNNRFVLRYLPQEDLSNPTFDEKIKSVIIYKNGGTLHVNSPYESIAAVTVYDLTGRLIFERKDCNTTRFETNELLTVDQALIVKVVLVNGAVVSEKVL